MALTPEESADRQAVIDDCERHNCLYVCACGDAFQPRMHEKCPYCGAPIKLLTMRTVHSRSELPEHKK